MYHLRHIQYHCVDASQNITWNSKYQTLNMDPYIDCIPNDQGHEIKKRVRERDGFDGIVGRNVEKKSWEILIKNLYHVSNNLLLRRDVETSIHTGASKCS